MSQLGSVSVRPKSSAPRTRNRAYRFVFPHVSVLVDCDCEGDGRFLVRMSIPGRMARVRIGYAFGSRKTWVIERPERGLPGIRMKSLKEGCHALAALAMDRPSVKPYL